MELNSCFSSPTCTSITEHFGKIGSPAETFWSFAVGGLLDSLASLVNPKSQY
jgi:hypothetical protein